MIKSSCRFCFSLEAFESYKKSYEIQSNKWGIHDSFGRFYFERGLNKQSIAYLTKTIELNPLFLTGIYYRARAYSNLGEYEKAIIDFQKVIDLNPNFQGVLYEYAINLILSKDYQTAKKIITKREQNYPDSKKNQWLRAYLMAAVGEREKALKYINSNNRGFLLMFLKMKKELIQHLHENFEHHMQSQNSSYEAFLFCPSFEFLHSDPRFQEILAKHKELYEENLEKYGDI